MSQSIDQLVESISTAGASQSSPVVGESETNVVAPTPIVLVSPDKPPLTGQKYEGVHCIFLRNARMRFFIPSTKNFFGGFQSKTCLHDSGCCSHLIGVPSRKDLQEILRLFPPKSPDLRIAFEISKGVAGTHLVMTVKINKASNQIPVVLCSDLLPGQGLFGMESLRFYLCSEDAEYLSSSGDLTRVQQILLDSRVKIVSPNTKRRMHTLIGQDILRHPASITFEHTVVLVNPGVFRPTTDIWEVVQLFDEEFIAEGFHALLPENFNNLESDELTATDESFGILGED